MIFDIALFVSYIKTRSIKIILTRLNNIYQLNSKDNYFNRRLRQRLNTELTNKKCMC